MFVIDMIEIVFAFLVGMLGTYTALDTISSQKNRDGKIETGICECNYLEMRG